MPRLGGALLGLPHHAGTFLVVVLLAVHGAARLIFILADVLALIADCYAVGVGLGAIRVAE